MKQRTIRGISVLLTVTVAIALWVNNIRNNEDIVVYAREVFDRVKEIGTNTTEEQPFIILEVVDEKSVFDATNSHTVGEEELAYMVGGKEPFRTALEDIITLADADLNSGTAVFHEDHKRTQYEEQFNAIVNALGDKGLIETDNTLRPGDIDGSDYPLSQIKVETTLPLTVELEDDYVDSAGLICLIKEEQNVTAGYFAPAITGCYELTSDPITGDISVMFLGAMGESQAAPFLLKRPMASQQDSVSENSVSGNSVSDNSTSGAVSDNSTEGVSDNNVSAGALRIPGAGDTDGSGSDNALDTGTGGGDVNPSGSGNNGGIDAGTVDPGNGDASNSNTGAGAARNPNAEGGTDNSGGGTPPDQDVGAGNAGDPGNGSGATTGSGTGAGDDSDSGGQNGTDASGQSSRVDLVGDKDNLRAALDSDKKEEETGESLRMIEKQTVEAVRLGAQAGTTGKALYNYYASEAELPEGVDIADCIFVGTGTVTSTGNTGNTGGTSSTVNGVPSVTIYHMTYLGIQNNEWLKENVFGAETAGAASVEDIHLEVQVVTPDELNQDNANTGTRLDGTRLVYLNMDLRSGNASNTTGGSGTEGGTSGSPGGSVTAQTTAMPDLDQNVADTLKDKILDQTDPLPCVINSNAYKLLEAEAAMAITAGQATSKVYEVMNEAHDRGIPDSEGRFVCMSIFFVDGLLSDTGKAGTGTAGATLTAKKITQQLAPYSVDSVSFEEVFQRIEIENYEREQIQADEVEPVITPATCIQTILVYTPINTEIKKSAIRVLELQPCYDFSFAPQRGDSDAVKQNKLKSFKDSFLPADSQVTVELVGMTTSEFCGKIEDINAEYDMIYLGSNTGTMILNQKRDCTVYNDTSMFGIVYSHTGDKYTLDSPGFYGLVRNDSATKEFRFSGNDIRADQKNILLDYLESGAPIILASDFFVYDDNGTSQGISTGLLTNSNGENVQVAHNGVNYNRYGILDNSTYIYQFVYEASQNKVGSSDWNWNNRKYKNLLVEKKNGGSISDELSSWLNQPKLSIELLSHPTEYSYTTKEIANGGAKAIDSITYLEPNANGEYYLYYDFSIRDLADTQITSARYNVTLFIDFNSDGKYSKQSEKAEDIEIITLGDNTPVKESELRLGVTYRVSYRLPDGLAGVIPWKLEIKDTNRESIRDIAEGMTTVRSDRQRVRVLQIYENKNGGNSNLEDLINQNPNGLWATLLESVPEFEFEIISIAAEHYFNNRWKVDYATGSSNSPELNRIGDINTYDMILIGFADTFQSSLTSRTTAMDRVKALLDFADSGKSILFSHDNTNWKNAESQDYTLNMAIRDITGLDRYGVTIYRASEADRTLYENNNKIKNGEEIKAASVEELKDQLFGLDGLRGYSRDIAFKVNSNQTEMYSNTQGFVYTTVVGSGKITEPNRYPNLHYPGIGSGTWINQKNHQVRKINTGIITEYPFRLGEIINVNSSHSQYYQLDLESDRDGDGEGDIVVWYTMDNSVAGDNNDLYDRSPGDVRNNYFIYNRGNITYTGIGHSTINTSQDEIKLTINTMVAAYRASMRAPSVNFVESPQDTTKKSFAAAPYDELVGQDPVYRAYFQVVDSNFAGDSQKQIRIRIYMGTDQAAADTPAITLGPGNIVNVEDKTSALDWKVGHPETGELLRITGTDGKEYYELKNDTVYYIDIPLRGNLSEAKGIECYVEAETAIASKNFVSAKAYDHITINQMKLVDLD